MARMEEEGTYSQMFELWSGLEISRQEMEKFRVHSLFPELWSDGQFQRVKGWGWSYIGKTEFCIAEENVWVGVIYMRIELR